MIRLFSLYAFCFYSVTATLALHFSLVLFSFVGAAAVSAACAVFSK